MTIRLSRNNPVFATQRKTGWRISSSHPVANGNLSISPHVKIIFLIFSFNLFHASVNRLFGNLQIPGDFMGAIPLDLHQNDLQGKPVHSDQYMIQFLIFNMIQKSCTVFGSA